MDSAASRDENSRFASLPVLVNAGGEKRRRYQGGVV
jgi:hypothetical protein